MIAIGIHEGPQYLDCSERFLKSIQAVVDGYADGRIRVAAPFLKWSKQIIWEFCKEVGVPVDSTYSCEKGGVRSVWQMPFLQGSGGPHCSVERPS